MTLCVVLALVFVALNVGAFFLVVVDKRRSGTIAGRRRRVRESRFHILGLFGGGPGLFAAMSRVRHKTRKSRFLVPLTFYSFVGLAGWAVLFWLLDCLPFL